jgi:hypothetical protein
LFSLGQVRSKLDITILSLCGFPLLWLALFYAYMLCVRAKIGHLPTPMIDTSGFRSDRYPDAAEIALGFALLGVPIAAVVAPALIAICRRRLSPALFRWALALLGLSLILFLALWNVDPGSCVSWFLD